MMRAMSGVLDPQLERNVFMYQNALAAAEEARRLLGDEGQESCIPALAIRAGVTS
jgi:hypothetical protein